MVIECPWCTLDHITVLMYANEETDGDYVMASDQKGPNSIFKVQINCVLIQQQQKTKLSNFLKLEGLI